MLIPFSELFKKYNVRPTGVVHLGASEGQEALEYAKNGVRYAIWVEAITEVYNKLLAHLKNFPTMKSWAWNYCLGDEDNKQVTFHISNNGGQSSSFLEFGTHATAHPEVKYIRDVHLFTRRFDSLISEALSVTETKEVIPKLDFLNIDLQGAELMALKGMGNYLEQFKWAYIEVNKAPLYKGCPMVEDIDDYLAIYGLTRVETKWTGWGWGDAFYINFDLIKEK